MPVAAGLHYFLHEGGSHSHAPVVFIHGEGGDHLSWPSELRRLPGHRSYSLDLPGHGKSGGPGLQSVPGYARSVVEFLDAAGLGRAVLVGQGMGGAIALSVAADSPERAAGIVLIASGARLPVASTLLENSANPATLPLALQALLAAICSLQTEARLRESVSRRLSALRPTLLHGDLLACDSFDLTARLGSIRTPALVICGTEDKFTPLIYAETLASSLPGAALQTIDGAGHLVCLEQPRRLAGLLTIFLGTVPYVPGG